MSDSPTGSYNLFTISFYDNILFTKIILKMPPIQKCNKDTLRFVVGGKYQYLIFIQLNLDNRSSKLDFVIVISINDP